MYVYYDYVYHQIASIFSFNCVGDMYIEHFRERGHATFSKFLAVFFFLVSYFFGFLVAIINKLIKYEKKCTNIFLKHCALLPK